MKEKIALSVITFVLISVIGAAAMAISDVKVMQVEHKNMQKQVTDNKVDVEKKYDKIEKKLDWMVRNWPKK